ncbi:MAG: alpha/beta fold hydrolase [Armatimonadota bacterium]
MFTEQSFHSGELTLSYAAGAPSGPPLVLLHGVVRGWQDFLPILPALAARWRIYALDFRGHGASDRAGAAYRVADYVQDVVALLRGPVEEPAVIYGHSLGAMVACAAAASVPERVRAVVLEDPPFETMGSRIQYTPFLAQFMGMRRALARGPRPVRELAAELAEIRLPRPGGGTVRLGDLRDAPQLRFSARCLQRLDPAVLDPIVESRWLDGYEVETVMRGLRCPSLLLAGDPDAGGMLSSFDSDRLVELAADCVRVEFPGVGHLIHWSQPERLLLQVLPFLESLEPIGA